VLANFEDYSSDDKVAEFARCAVIALEDGRDLPDACKARLGGLRVTRAARVERAKRIVNGLTTFKYPTTGALLRGVNAQSAKMHCSGVLIACDKFLTAAHCVENSPKPALHWVYFQHAGIHSVANVIWPEDYPEKADQADIALITLVTPVSGLSPMRINDLVSDVPFGYRATIAGFGRTGGTPKGGPVEDYGVKRIGFVETDKCPSTLEPEYHICWRFDSLFQKDGLLGSNTCNADSGGPLIDEMGSPILLGLTTAGARRNCGLRDHSWDVNVYRWRKWLAARGIGSFNPGTCGDSASVDVDRHVVGETRRLGSETTSIEYVIETSPNTQRLMVAINGEDDGTGANDFDLFVSDPLGQGSPKHVCVRNGAGQFAFCSLDDPRPGPWQIKVQRKRGEGLVQVVVTRVQ
jgi:hypothetical protein